MIAHLKVSERSECLIKGTQNYQKFSGKRNYENLIASLKEEQFYARGVKYSFLSQFWLLKPGMSEWRIVK